MKRRDVFQPLKCQHGKPRFKRSCTICYEPRDDLPAHDPGPAHPFALGAVVAELEVSGPSVGEEFAALRAARKARVA